MTQQLDKVKITAALTKVPTIDGDSDIVTAGAVSGIVIKNGHISFTIEIDPKDKEMADRIKAKAEKIVLALDGVLSATALITAHQAGSSTPTSSDIPSNTPIDSAESNNVEPYQPATHVIAVASGKGGVGKSTTSINLALALISAGKKVGILDADIYGPSLPRLIGLNRKPQSDGKKIIPINVWGLQSMSIGYLVAEDAPMIWRGPMVISAIEQMLRDVAWEELDILVIDMPPGTGDAQLTLSQRAKLSGAVIVSTPQDLALIDARKGLNMFRKVNVPLLGIIENMSYFLCNNCGTRHEIFGNGGAAVEAEKLGVPFLGEVPLDMLIRSTSDEGTPIVASQPENPHSKHFLKIADNLIQMLDNTQTKIAPKIIME